MCTLIVWVDRFAGLPLLIAANRDEQLDRRATPPQVEQRGDTRVLAPRDLAAGGTWIGVNEHGVFSAITNRFGLARDPHRRTRGVLVLDALAHRRARDAAEKLTALDPARENGFHLVIADRDSAHLVWNDGTRMEHRDLPPGVHVITERSLGAAPSSRGPLIAELLAELDPKVPPADEALRSLLATHRESPLDSVCVHADAMNYGTRCSTVVRFGTDVKEMMFRHADGRPCVTDFASYALD